MRKQLAVASIALLMSFPALSQTAQSKAPKTQKMSHSKAATSDWKAIHNSALVIDTHADTPGRFVDEDFDPANDAGRGHWDLAKVKQGNLGAEFFSIWVDPQGNEGHYTRRALDMIDSVYETTRKHPNEMAMAFSTADIQAARRGPHKRLASLMGVEGGHAIEGDIRVLRDFYRLGVRYMTLTWANSNEIGQSSGDVKKDANGKPIDPGLTDFGRDVVREMNRLGMMVDISHVSDRTFYNTLVVSRAPVIASHSSSRAITEHARNMTDDMLVALARNNGVAQVNFNCGFISNDYIARAKQFREQNPDLVKKADELQTEYRKTKSPEVKKQLDAMMDDYNKQVQRPPLSALIDHIDHMVKIAGIDHVGIGSDFDGVECLPEGIDGVQDLPKITEQLVKKGYSSDDIHKIWGGNLMRVFADVEHVSRELDNEANKDSRPEVAIPTKK